MFKKIKELVGEWVLAVFMCGIVVLGHMKNPELFLLLFLLSLVFLVIQIINIIRNNNNEEGRKE